MTLFKVHIYTAYWSRFQLRRARGEGELGFVLQVGKLGIKSALGGK